MPSRGSASEEIAAILKQHGGVLKRQNKHEFWKFPTGEIFTRSCTPSDIHAEDNALRDLRRILNLNGERGAIGERRVRALKHEKPSRPSYSSPTLKSALAEKLALAGLAEAAHESEVSTLKRHIVKLQKECALKDKSLRRYKKQIAAMRAVWGMRLAKWVHGLLPRWRAWRFV